MAMGYIDREEAIRAIEKYEGYFQEQLSSKNLMTKIEAMCVISDIESADVRLVVYGEWEARSDRPDTLICSVRGCGYDMWKHDPHNYCPNCGCYMGGKANG